jgi:hypothetical protein
MEFATDMRNRIGKQKQQKRRMKQYRNEKHDQETVTDNKNMKQYIMRNIKQEYETVMKHD